MLADKRFKNGGTTTVTLTVCSSILHGNLFLSNYKHGTGVLVVWRLIKITINIYF